jgi:TorA maturation chaperone TorD
MEGARGAQPARRATQNRCRFMDKEICDMNERELIYQSRQAVYALLRRLFDTAPDPELHAWLVAERPFAEFPIVFPEDASHFLEQVDQASQQFTPEDLRQDFLLLFWGPGRMEAPPWESVYRNDERRLFDSHTLQVRETYARHGMEFVEKNKMPEDHIAIELEFMRILTERLLKALELGDETAERILLQEQLDFLNGHLRIWVPPFVGLVQQHARTAFYGGLAGVLTAFLDWDAQALEQLLAVLPQE